MWAEPEGEAAERWRRSPHYRLLETGASLMRRRVTVETKREFALFPALWEAGITEFLATVNRLSVDGVIGEMDCFCTGWMTYREGGFPTPKSGCSSALHPSFAIKSASLSVSPVHSSKPISGATRDSAVLQGRIVRGVADRIKAVLWFSDLRNYTRILDSALPEEIIPLLDDYADAIVSAIHQHSGDVLKLIGDGVLAIFPTEDRSRACAAALDAADEARTSVEAVNERRRAEGLPTTEMYLGLHLGVVFYGNIGSKERLDFTVVGPAVNEVARIAALCRSVDQPILMSSAVAANVTEDRRRFASVGRFALRGVGEPQELYTLDAQG